MKFNIQPRIREHLYFMMDYDRINNICKEWYYTCKNNDHILALASHYKGNGYQNIKVEGKDKITVIARAFRLECTRVY